MTMRRSQGPRRFFFAQVVVSVVKLVICFYGRQAAPARRKKGPRRVGFQKRKVRRPTRLHRSRFVRRRQEQPAIPSYWVILLTHIQPLSRPNFRRPTPSSRSAIVKRTAKAIPSRKGGSAPPTWSCPPLKARQDNPTAFRTSAEPEGGYSPPPQTPGFFQEASSHLHRPGMSPTGEDVR